MEGFFGRKRDIVEDGAAAKIESGKKCPVCNTGELEEISSGMLACTDCNFSD
jgi:ribosomal protein L37AE/L43A